MEPPGPLQPSVAPSQLSASLPAPAHSALPRRRGLPPSRDTPKSRDGRAQAPSTGAGPERAARVLALLEPVPDSAPAAGTGRRRPVPVRSLPGTSSGATSGAHVGSGGPAPLPGAGARIPGRGLGTRAALASSHAPRPAPGRGRTAPPPAPAHRLTPALTHTHTPSRALTHALPSLLLLCLSPPAVWGPRRSHALRLRHAVSAPAPRNTVGGYATAMAPGSFQNSERGPQSSLPPHRAPGQRLLPVAPTNLLAGKPPLRRGQSAAPLAGTAACGRAGKPDSALEYHGSRSFSPSRSSCSVSLPRPVTISYLDAPPIPLPDKRLSSHLSWDPIPYAHPESSTAPLRARQNCPWSSQLGNTSG